MKIIQFIGTIFFLIFALGAIAQNNTPLLDRKVSVNFSNLPLNEALFTLSEKAGFNLSYNSNILQPGSLVSFKCEDKKLSEVFSTIIPKGIEIQTSGNNVILLKKAVKELKKKDIIITGKVNELHSGRPIAGATVLDIYGSQSVLTDSTGNFKVRLAHKQQDLLVSVSKANHRDTSAILVAESQDLIFRLQKIEPLKVVDLIKTDTIPIEPVEDYPLSKLMVPEVLVTHSENIQGYTNRIFQLSITPGASSNLKIAGTVKNKFSINLIGGYNYGVGLLELGGAFNINRTNVSGLQIAGITNLVGGEVNGLQIAGVFNKTKGKVSGVQASGFGNLNTNAFSGLQLSGASNIGATVQGVQITGGVNSAGSLSGFQLATLYNKSSLLDGLQFSIGLNTTDSMNGVQIGLVNRATLQNGFQFGLVNINGSSKGLSIGLVNFIKDKKFPRFLFAYR